MGGGGEAADEITYHGNDGARGQEAHQSTEEGSLLVLGVVVLSELY